MTALSTVGSTVVIKKVVLTLLAEAVTTAVSPAEKEPTVAVNVAVEAPAATETLDGTVTLV